ncbi:MAG: two-component system, cell cycle sensor histidine kinase and response regulator CckA [Blastocatellia bacterium]|jgi:CheY-like chemotaxis protein|nr:two-component system, cell cycle sensor histidine kinase and response regulator CckA [Blastocatellia bacterium]
MVKKQFSAGNLVRITRGVFASFVGMVIRVDDLTEQLTVLGRIEGQPDSERGTLNISALLVEKLSETLGGTETVLLVEDDELVRRLVHEVLENCGYRLLDAANVVEALSTCEQSEGPIHLLVTDIVMPRMSGRETANRLAALRPEIKVLCMSEYTNGAIIHHGMLDADTPFIQKPFAPDALARKVREVLDS